MSMESIKQYTIPHNTSRISSKYLYVNLRYVARVMFCSCSPSLSPSHNIFRGLADINDARQPFLVKQKAEGGHLCWNYEPEEGEVNAIFGDMTQYEA